MDPQPPVPKPPAYYIAIHPDYPKTLFVSLDVSRLLEQSNDIHSIVVWFNRLTEDATVLLNIHCGSSHANLPVAAYVTVINAITTCKANVIGNVDHIFSASDSFFLLACKSLRISAFGQIVFKGSDVFQTKYPKEMAAALAAFCEKMLRNAVAVGLLTEEECNRIVAGESVFLTPTMLDKRVNS